MSEVVDLSLKRVEKAVKQSGDELLGGPAPPGATVVSVLGCNNCGSTEFRLGHHDPIAKRESNVVICAKCCVQISSLRWFDVNRPEPAA
jgi:hypothetical protein